MDFDIIFCNPSQEFYAGQILSGIVLLRLEKPMTLKALGLELKGKAKFRWYANKTYYTSRAEYLQTNIAINIPPNSAVYGVGTHRFPFAIILPILLPESYEDEFGRVKYKATALLKSATNITFLKDTILKKKAFIVRASLPIPDSLNTMMVEDESKPLPCLSSCCLCWSFGEVCANITTDKGGYLPGETIVFKAEISNNSTKDLRNVTLTLKKSIYYHCKSYRHDVTRNVGGVLTFNKGVNSHEDATWSVRLKLPQRMPPTNLGPFKTIIELTYYLELEVGKYAGCCAPKVLFKLPLMIGSAAP